VVHVAVEMAPIAKVGGMGDVVTALARAVQEEGHTVEVVVPKYDIISYHQVRLLHDCYMITCNSMSWFWGRVAEDWWGGAGRPRCGGGGAQV
jgi:starch synthase